MIGALCLVVSLSYGALYYGFAVLITRPAAGGEFSRSLLSAAYGGAVVTGGVAAVAVGRAGDRFGVRWLIAGGSVVGAGGLLAFSAAQAGWQVLAVWWLVLGPAAALTFYEPAYVAIQQAFGPDGRAQAIAVLTLAAGLSGPVFTPLTGALVEALGWRDATRVLALGMACAAPVTALLITVRPPPGASVPRQRLRKEAFGTSRVRLFTLGAVLAYGATEALIVHRIARFQELGFSLATVTFWAALSGLATLPGRFLLPLLARRVAATTVFAGVLAVLAVAAALMIDGGAYWQMSLSFVVFGLVFGSALPLRAVVMGEWTATAVFGAVMGAQAAVIAAGRAGAPALVGGMHDAFDGYTAAMALTCALLVAAAVLVALSGRARR